MTTLNRTHDAARRSWVASANGHADFPLQNLPLGVFTPATGTKRDGTKRGGIAVGDLILDIPACRHHGLLGGNAETAAEAMSGGTLNALLALGAGPRTALRQAVFDLLAEDAPAAIRDLAPEILHEACVCEVHLPVAIGGYTDFFAGIQHAINAGRLFRPDGEPLMPNYKYVPVAYHGRASSVRPSGWPVRRPNGQRKRGKEDAPTYGACRNLDYELEMGIWVGAGNALGEPVPISRAGEHIAGFCLLNDWSARDIQGWEAQPLGPFLAKNFHTSVSPWVVTAEALAPFRIPQSPRDEGDPAPLPHLSDADDQAQGAFDIEVEALLLTATMREAGAAPHRLSIGNTRHLYWTPAQMLAHHTSNGCDLNAGDLFGSGTISAPEDTGWGSLLEISRAGRQPISLPSGESRTFLQDGDEIILRARCTRDGMASIGFGECRGMILPAPTC